MGLFINTNLGSLNAQRQLNSTSLHLGRSFERLSSGLRINSAKDDAAGLSITTRFTAQIRGLNQAIRNSNDGISLAQTAEGALSETTNILQRMRELAVQSANDTNNDADRGSIQGEVAQLKEELDRIAATTNFNGNNILNGDFLSHKFQVGANVDETINVTIAGASTKDLARQIRVQANTFVSTADSLVAGELNFKSAAPGADPAGVDVRAAVAGDDQLSTSLNQNSAIAKAAAINSSSEFSYVRAIVGKAEASGAAAVGAIDLDETNFLTINDEKISGFSVSANDATGSLRDAINAVADETGVVASLSSTGQLTLTAEDGRNMAVEVAGGAGAQAALGFGASSVLGGQITFQSNYQFDVTSTATSRAALGDFPANNAANLSTFGLSSAKSVDAIDVSTREGSVEALDLIDLALEDVSSSRANLGALQNRLESTINNLSTTSENLSASRSRILDADFASETAQLSRNQIIQQAGVSILAQANQQPQIALSLLG